MFLNFLIQEEGENTKILEYQGDYTVKSLEAIFEQLINPDCEWFKFDSKPHGFITRKKHIKTVYLKESR